MLVMIARLVIMIALIRAFVRRRFSHYLDGFEQGLAQSRELAMLIETTVMLPVRLLAAMLAFAIVASRFCHRPQGVGRFA